MMTTTMTLPIIKSVGPPPEKYADRIVAEMLRMIVRARTQRMKAITVMAGRSDGGPRAQGKMLKALEQQHRPFVLSTLLEPGKRGRYKIHAVFIEGWDADKKQIIVNDYDIPDKPWLACHRFKFTSKGRGEYDQDLGVMMMITHHALSRLVQRCGAKSAGDLIAAVGNIFWAYVERITKDSKPIGNDERLRFKTTETLSAYAVLQHYADGQGGIVVATILDTI